MKLKVFNRETATIETIEAKYLDVTKHFHLNTHKAFTKEDLLSFGHKAKSPTKEVEAKEDVKTEKKSK